jgi:hypothetical protein
MEDPFHLLCRFFIRGRELDTVIARERIEVGVVSVQDRIRDSVAIRERRAIARVWQRTVVSAVRTGRDP